MVGSWEWEIATDIIEWSEELCRIYGIEHGVHHTFETFVNSVHPDDRVLVQALVQEAFASGTPFSFEHRIVQPDGTERAMLARGEVALGPDGSRIKMLGTGQDITERKLTEAALEASERQLSATCASDGGGAAQAPALEGEDLRDLVDEPSALHDVLERDVGRPSAGGGRAPHLVGTPR